MCIGEVKTSADLPNAQVSVDAGSGCQDLAPGQQVNIPVSATLGSAVADGGQISGGIDIVLISAPTDELPSQERTVTVGYTMQVLPIGPVLWVPFLLTALGIIIPLLVLYLLNWRAARLDLEGIMMARVPVTIEPVDGASIQRADRSEGPLLSHQDFSFVAAPARPRRWVPLTETIRARVPKSPFGSVRGEVATGGSSLVVSNVAPVRSSDGRKAGLGLNPSMNAYLLVDPTSLTADPELNEVGSGRVRAELVAFLVPEVLSRDAALLSSEIGAYPGWGAEVTSLAAIAATTSSTLDRHATTSEELGEQIDSVDPGSVPPPPPKDKFSF